MSKTARNLPTSKFALKRETLKSLVVNTGLKAGCDAGCSTPNSGCTNNSGKGNIGHVKI